MTPSLARRIFLRLPLLTGLAAAALWLTVADGSQVAEIIIGADPIMIGIMAGLTGTWLAARFVRWQFMLRRTGNRIPIRGSAAGYLAGLPGTLTPAYVGEIIRAVFIRHRYGTPLRVTGWILIAERLMDVMALALMLAASTADRLATSLLLLIGLAAGLFGWGATRLADSKTKTRVQSAAWIGPVVVMSIIAWIAAGTLVYVAALSTGHALPFTDSIRVFCEATLAAAVTLMPAGIGSVGSVMIFELRSTGIPLTDAIAITSVVRAMSAGLVLSVGTGFMVRELRRIRATRLEPTSHFDTIAHEYADQFRDHVWQHLLSRKIGFIETTMARRSGAMLDLGCGLGVQAAEMIQRGHRTVGVDRSLALLRRAQVAGVPVSTADAVHLPFADGTFSNVYAIGVLHHLESVETQRAVCKEVERILKPGGRFLVHESNIQNPLFRFYVGYVFPLLKSIDEGTEIWIHPRTWREVPGFALVDIRYFTFLPDFVPRIAMRPMLALERALEASLLAPYSVHYFAVLEKAD